MTGSKKITLTLIFIGTFILVSVGVLAIFGRQDSDDRAMEVETSIKIKSKITKDEAIEIVKKKMESKEGEILSTKLLVDRERPCWFISYIDRDPEGPGTAWGTGAYIDAITGEDITEDFNM